MTSGLDVSVFQHVIDFDALTRVDRDLAFVMVKASEGVGFTDPMFARNYSEARRVGLVRGAYHFGRPDLGNTPADEAAYFFATVRPEPGDVLALDYEVAYRGDPDAWCAEFLSIIASAVGVPPLLYLNLNAIRTHDWSRSVATGAGLWLALYDGDSSGFVPATPWPVVAMKQYTNSGRVAGIDSNVDLDFFFGDRDALLRYGVKEKRMDTPQRMGQSADLALRPGELGTMQGIYSYAAHPEGRSIVWKVRGGKPGRIVIYMYPPVDPDADATMVLGADPCVFMVDVLPS